MLTKKPSRKQQAGMSPEASTHEIDHGSSCPPGCLDASAGTESVTFESQLARLDEGEFGYLGFDILGKVKSAWGLARYLPWVVAKQNLFQSPLARLAQEGGALYLEGVRYYSPGLTGGATESYILTTNAHDERKARRQASKGWRVANTLKRLGKALTSNLTTTQICLAAAHELASSLELAATLVWVIGDDGFNLQASLGVSRRGRQLVERLSTPDAPSCVAETVAVTGNPYSLIDLSENPLAEFEIRSCFLKARGLCALPLSIAGQLIGVLELVGRDGDTTFEENLDLFQTAAEHLALALNSAALYEQAERTALIDSLTGIPNHRALYSFLQIRWQEIERTGQELAVIMIDVDHFRRFNEEEGHDAGDDVLRKVGQTLKASVRPYDLAARYGGEEFTLILPATNDVGAMRLAERARLAVEQIDYRSADGTPRKITISLGCAVFSAKAMSSPEQLLKAADTALYLAKKAGRNCAVLFEDADGMAA